MTFAYLTGICRAAIEGLNETRERVGYPKLALNQALCEGAEGFAKQLVAEGRFGRDRKLRGAAECNFMSRTGEITLKTYKLAFESWLSQYNTFNWEKPEGGNAWSNLMHKNSKEIGIGGALTKGGNAIIIARVTPVPDLSPETLPKLLPTDARRLPQAYYSFGQQDEPDDFLSLWSKNLGPNMRRKTAPVKQVKMPDKPVSRSSLGSVKFGKEKVRSESERDSGIREEDSNDDVFSSGLNKDRSFGNDMPYGSEKFGKTPIQSPFFNNNADVSFADNAPYGNGGTSSVSEMRSPRSFDTSFGDNVKFGSEAVPTPLHFESRGRLITRGSDDEMIEPKREKSKNKTPKSSPKNKVKIVQKQLTVIKGSHRGEWQPRLEVRATGITPKIHKIVNGVFKFMGESENGEGLYFRSMSQIWLRCQKNRMSFAPTNSEKGCWVFAKNTSAGNVPTSGWKMFSEKQWTEMESLTIWSV